MSDDTKKRIEEELRKAHEAERLKAQQEAERNRLAEQKEAFQKAERLKEEKRGQGDDFEKP